ncbi:CQ058 protein, partial [Atractosteus spatula]|nr:CQ058 protein [Atractosteus spatula]
MRNAITDSGALEQSLSRVRWDRGGTMTQHTEACVQESSRILKNNLFLPFWSDASCGTSPPHLRRPRRLCVIGPQSQPRHCALPSSHKGADSRARGSGTRRARGKPSYRQEKRILRRVLHRAWGTGGAREKEKNPIIINQDESEHTQEAICLSECRKEKEERDYFCHSEFAINGIVHDIEAISKGMKILTLLVNSDGFYKMSQLTITPDGFFFKVRVLVVDTYKCAKPCPDLKLGVTLRESSGLPRKGYNAQGLRKQVKQGSRYIVMGQIYPRRRNRPSELQALQVGRLRAGDGLVRSHSYVKRFNKRRDQKVQEAKRTKCR